MFRSNVKIAIDSLRAARTRTILTTIGITIGIASILLVFAAGAGARVKASENVNEIPLTTDLLASGTGNPASASPFDPVATRGASVFTEHDLASLEDTKVVTAAAPVMEIAGPITYHNSTDTSAFIGGTSSNLFKLLGLQFVDGGTFDPDMPNSVVLGREVAENIFGTELASGKTLTIRGDEYTVVGVLTNAQIPLEITGLPIDHTAFIPYAQAKTYTSGYAQFNRIFITADPALFGRINETLTRNHGNQTDFSLIRASEVKVTSPLLSVLVSVTAVTAGLSLIIGGIGIMNIMLVNVSERTREIGIRKSIGASNGTVLVQFLIEAAVMSVAGGILGTLVAMAVGVIAGLFLPFGLLFTPGAIIGVLCVSLVIGILFGLFPAIRAARKDTIEALRYYQ